MNKGVQIGGPVANPIREMLSSEKKDGVIFHHTDEKKAETTRYAALMLKRRNGYSYKTMRRGENLIVYKTGVDPFEMHGTDHVYFKDLIGDILGGN